MSNDVPFYERAQELMKNLGRQTTGLIRQSRPVSPDPDPDPGQFTLEAQANGDYPDAQEVLTRWKAYPKLIDEGVITLQVVRHGRTYTGKDAIDPFQKIRYRNVNFLTEASSYFEWGEGQSTTSGAEVPPGEPLTLIRLRGTG